MRHPGDVSKNIKIKLRHLLRSQKSVSWKRTKLRPSGILFQSSCTYSWDNPSGMAWWVQEPSGVSVLLLHRWGTAKDVWDCDDHSWFQKLPWHLSSGGCKGSPGGNGHVCGSCRYRRAPCLEIYKQACGKLVWQGLHKDLWLKKAQKQLLFIEHFGVK